MVPIQIIDCVNKSSQGHARFAFGFFLALPFHRRCSQRHLQNSQLPSALRCHSFLSSLATLIGRPPFIVQRYHHSGLRDY
jgi:hypothetical protein